MKELIKKIDKKTISGCCYIFWIIALAILFVTTFRINFTGSISLTQFCMVICIMLLVSTAADRPWTVKTKAFMRLTVTLALCLWMHEMACGFMPVNPDLGIKIKAVMDAFDGVMVLCFWIYLSTELDIREKEYRAMNVICIVAATAAAAFNVFNAVFECPLVDPAVPMSARVWGENGWIANGDKILIYSMVVIVVLTSVEIQVRSKLVLLTYVATPIVAVFFKKNFGQSYTFMAYTISLIVIFINIYLQRGRQLLEQQVAMEKQATALMISQIQPHFLYNTLTTISNLCATDPEEAEETTVLFAQYLRANLDSLRSEEPVSFNTELDHIRTYVEIEKKRFGDKLNVEYDIEDGNFTVPSLGLQPIVENSIKHGIRGKDTPGHLKVTCLRKGKGHLVIIEDDGVGFDTGKTEYDDGRSHVGIENVRSRLMNMCKANMQVISRPGCGCCTKIYFPAVV